MYDASRLSLNIQRVGARAALHITKVLLHQCLRSKRFASSQILFILKPVIIHPRKRTVRSKPRSCLLVCEIILISCLCSIPFYPSRIPRSDPSLETKTLSFSFLSLTSIRSSIFSSTSLQHKLAMIATLPNAILANATVL